MVVVGLTGVSVGDASELQARTIASKTPMPTMASGLNMGNPLAAQD